MKREFEYFLFENFEADQEAENLRNPRKILGKGTDPLLSEIAQLPAGECSYAVCCHKFGQEQIDSLIACGVLRLEKEALFFDSPVFLRKDAEILREAVTVEAKAITDILEPSISQLSMRCAELKNGFSVKVNLYHILCGMLLDGHFFDYLSGMGVVSTSRWHPSGLDYLTVIYEKCGELRLLSDGLLCSYNRLANDLCALESFGDADGNRKDFYRLFRLMEKEKGQDRFREEKYLLCETFGGADKSKLLFEVLSLIKTGKCLPAVMTLLENFGYAKAGEISVPVYLPEHRLIIMEMEAIVEECLGEVMANMLLTLSEALPITSAEHGVNRLEVANEIYHLFFGGINEELVRRGHVAAPEYLPGQGRYLKCIEVYQ